MQFGQGWVPLGLKLAILLVLCLHLPGVTPRSMQRADGRGPGRARRQAEDLEPRSSEEEAMDFFDPLLRVLQEIPTPTLPTPGVLWSWIPLLRNLLGLKNGTSTPGPAPAPKTSASPRAAVRKLPVSLQPPEKNPGSAPLPRLEFPVSIQPQAPELGSSVQPATEDPFLLPKEESC